MSKGHASGLTFFASHLRVEVRSELPEVTTALRTVWAACSRPMLPTTRVLRFEAAAHGKRFAVALDGSDPLVVELREDVLPVLEAGIYERLRACHEPLVLLHAACVRRGPSVLLFTGPSGAGKSSLALEAVRRGFEYYSDELSVTDGERVWGIPRAIQFDPIARGLSPPPWASDADLGSYLLRLRSGAVGVVPLWCPPIDRVALTPAPASSVRIYAVEHGDVDGLEPLAPLASLARLHEAAYRPPSRNLGSLVHCCAGGRLTWSDPSHAFELLLAELSSSDSMSPLGT